MWFAFALGSAVFAALTSILAKIGIEGVNSNLATAIRTIVVVSIGVMLLVVAYKKIYQKKKRLISCLTLTLWQAL